jgi:group I intron endonuclease
VDCIIPIKPGVYKIANKKTGRFYIGSSQNLRRRMKAHFKDLRLGTHSNKFLQRSFVKDGKENFTFEILEICLKEECLIKEQAVIDKYWDLKPSVLYNAIKEVFQEPITIDGETIRTTRGFLRGERHHKFGTKNSKELLKALSDASRKTWSNPEHIRFMSESFSGKRNPFYGQKHTQESLNKIIETKIKSGYCKPVTATNINTGIVISANSNAELARMIGVTKSVINTRTNVNHESFTVSPILGVWKVKLLDDSGEQELLDIKYSKTDQIMATNIKTNYEVKASGITTMSRIIGCSKSAIWVRISGKIPISKLINKTWEISLINDKIDTSSAALSD